MQRYDSHQQSEWFIRLVVWRLGFSFVAIAAVTTWWSNTFKAQLLLTKKQPLESNAHKFRGFGLNIKRQAVGNRNQHFLQRQFDPNRKQKKEMCS